MKIEFARLWEDNTWDTEIYDTPFPDFPYPLTDDTLLEWFYRVQGRTESHRRLVAAVVYNNAPEAP